LVAVETAGQGERVISERSIRFLLFWLIRDEPFFEPVGLFRVVSPAYLERN